MADVLDQHEVDALLAAVEQGGVASRRGLIVPDAFEGESPLGFEDERRSMRSMIYEHLRAS